MSSASVNSHRNPIRMVDCWYNGQVESAKAKEEQKARKADQTWILHPSIPSPVLTA
jgi:hypothetical protein